MPVSETEPTPATLARMTTDTIMAIHQALHTLAEATGQTQTIQEQLDLLQAVVEREMELAAKGWQSGTMRVYRPDEAPLAE